VNISKFTQLKQSLQQAFSGKILAGSPSVLTGQAAVLESPAQQTARFADPAQAIRQSIARSLQRREQANLRRIASQVQSYAKARGDAVLQVLLAHGVSPARLSVAGYAAERPLASNASAAGRARNRRVELVVLRRAAPEGGPTP